MSTVPNILAERYATQAMKSVWSPEGKIVLERGFWIAIMKAQRDLGLEIPGEAITAYEAVKHEVNLKSIGARERVSRHDVKARIDEFCELAGHQHIHKGLTSRDLTENVEQLQVFRSLTEVRFKSVAALHALSGRAREYRNLYLTARTHNVPAQITTLGKRIAMFGEEMLGALRHLDQLIETYPVRGLKGAVGTQLDQLNLFGGNHRKVADLEKRLVEHLGLPGQCRCVGQVYPRSIDFRIVSVLCELASGPGSFATTLRLMAGHELASEGFAPGQTGSSAMPHKMNSPSCERINGFHTLLKGYLAMAAGLTGSQWNEGDVSCSVVRRVMIPDSFFAIDGLLETFITVLRQMTVYEHVIEDEILRYLPFLLSTTFLMEAVKSGVGRETAHEAIKENALAAVEALRSGESLENELLGRLAADPRLGLSPERLQELLNQGRSESGAAADQVDHFCYEAEALLNDEPGAASYQPGGIL